MEHPHTPGGGVGNFDVSLGTQGWEPKNLMLSLRQQAPLISHPTPPEM